MHAWRLSFSQEAAKKEISRRKKVYVTKRRLKPLVYGYYDLSICIKVNQARLTVLLIVNMSNTSLMTLIVLYLTSFVTFATGTWVFVKIPYGRTSRQGIFTCTHNIWRRYSFTQSVNSNGQRNHKATTIWYVREIPRGYESADFEYRCVILRRRIAEYRQHSFPTCWYCASVIKGQEMFVSLQRYLSSGFSLMVLSRIQ